MTAQRPSLTRYAWISIAAASATILLKLAAYLMTGSVGLLSDAVESVVNLFGAVMALGMLSWAAQAADDKHPSGHGKAEYFSSGTEGALIILAAGGIAVTAIERLLHPRPLEQIGLGLAVSVVASAINLVVARILLSAGRRHNSITLEADGRHLLTDVVTSAGVVLGIGLVMATGWSVLDPIVALLVSANIVWTGIALIRRSVDGLMDVGLPEEEQKMIERAMAAFRAKGVAFHALRTRQAAAQRFISVHMLVPGDWTVHDAHHLAEDFEQELGQVLGEANITTHLEPIEDENSFHGEAAQAAPADGVE
ncbi:MAG: cation diffusion facilitator family transporter [Desulfobulbus sp.]|jgi:cation diffusion facilitator family transporter|uniref:cation diffusion facilitator family transporter n=1 Tax=Desulfobulbus sp. TaxID=895 RepID=UPI00283D2261|nr:cation diffusion facilitator family transporter [Desulfobulbus sp.]MDR2548719.1 cation diffusion facilitator family transporter [Desulfobulbus sp.]